MYTRKPYKLWYTQSVVQRPTIFSSGLRLPQLIATSAKVSFGESLGKVFGAQSAVSNVMKNAKTCSTQIAYNVSHFIILNMNTGCENKFCKFEFSEAKKPP